MKKLIIKYYEKFIIWIAGKVLSEGEYDFFILKRHVEKSKDYKAISISCENDATFGSCYGIYYHFEEDGEHKCLAFKTLKELRKYLNV